MWNLAIDITLNVYLLKYSIGYLSLPNKEIVCRATQNLYHKGQKRQNNPNPRTSNFAYKLFTSYMNFLTLRIDFSSLSWNVIFQWFTIPLLGKYTIVYLSLVIHLFPKKIHVLAILMIHIQLVASLGQFNNIF